MKMKIKIELTNGEIVADSQSFEYDNQTSMWYDWETICAVFSRLTKLQKLLREETKNAN